MLIIKKCGMSTRSDDDEPDEEDADEEPEWNDPIHLIDVAYSRVQMLISIGAMTHHKYVALQVFTINIYITIDNYITTNKSSQPLLLVILLMRCSTTSSARPSTRTRTRAWSATSRFLL